MHPFIPSSGDALIAREKLFHNAGTTKNDLLVQPVLFAAGMNTFRFIHFVVFDRTMSLWGKDKIRLRPTEVVYLLPFKKRSMNSDRHHQCRVQGLDRTFRSARQADEIDHPAFMAAMQAYEGHQPGNSGAGSKIGFMIHVVCHET